MGFFPIPGVRIPYRAGFVTPPALKNRMYRPSRVPGAGCCTQSRQRVPWL